MSTQLTNAVLGGGLVQVVRSAEEIGLLGALDAPATATELASRLGLDERAVGLTLEVLRAATSCTSRPRTTLRG